MGILPCQEKLSKISIKKTMSTTRVPTVNKLRAGHLSKTVINRKTGGVTWEKNML
jgi:hypothetical protein